VRRLEYSDKFEADSAIVFNGGIRLVCRFIAGFISWIVLRYGVIVEPPSEELQRKQDAVRKGWERPEDVHFSPDFFITH
jgi:hypothetical protein